MLKVIFYFVARSGLTKVINSRVQTRVSVFPIHIVRAAARIILNPDTKVLHVRGVLLSELSIKEIKLNYAYRSLLPFVSYLINIKNLSCGFFHFSHLVHKIPES